MEKLWRHVKKSAPKTLFFIIDFDWQSQINELHPNDIPFIVQQKKNILGFDVHMGDPLGMEVD